MPRETGVLSRVLRLRDRVRAKLILTVLLVGTTISSCVPVVGDGDAELGTTDACTTSFDEALAIVHDTIAQLAPNAFVFDGYGTRQGENKEVFIFSVLNVDEYWNISITCRRVVALQRGGEENYALFVKVVQAAAEEGRVFARYGNQTAASDATKTTDREEGVMGAPQFDSFLGHWVTDESDCSGEGGLWIVSNQDTISLSGWEWNARVSEVVPNEGGYSLALEVLSEGELSQTSAQLRLDAGHLVLDRDFGEFCCGAGSSSLVKCP